MVRLSSRRRHLKVMMKEKKVFWENGSLVGEGLWGKASTNTGVVICHPHPQMGGSMHNNVVETIRDVFAAHDHSTLRFNFRGVGGSTGRYDEGRGEKQDVLSACEFMKNQDIDKIILAGYSFGAWVCCCLLKDRPSGIGSVILISPPQTYFTFNWEGLEGAVALMICGDSDPFCDVDGLKVSAKQIHAALTILPATDHFFAGREVQLAESLEQYFTEKKA